jgi:hypothetical protein
MITLQTSRCPKIQTKLRIGVALAAWILCLFALPNYAGDMTSSDSDSVLSELNASSMEAFTTTTLVPAVCNWHPSQSQQSNTTASSSTTAVATTALQYRALLAKPGIAPVAPRCRP